MENFVTKDIKNSELYPSSSPNSEGKLSQAPIFIKGKTSSHFPAQEATKISKADRLRSKYKTQRRIVALLDEVGEKTRSLEMANCGRFEDARTCGIHILSKVPNYRCNVRYCALCANRRSGRYQRKYLPYAQNFLKYEVESRRDENGKVINKEIVKRKSPLTPCLLTLTQKKKAGEKLANARARLLKSFKNFVRHKFFSEYFAGGLFAVENTTADGNHCHLHVTIFRKKFINHDLLKKHWFAVSDGAKNLNIKLIDDLENGLRETIKYISKPIDIDNFTKQNMLELLEIKGQRMIDTFGEFREFCQLYELPKIEEKQEREPIVEGDLCPCCNDGQSRIFNVRMTRTQLIEFYEQRGSPPTQNH